jgi:hypothetical protein
VDDSSYAQLRGYPEFKALFGKLVMLSWTVNRKKSRAAQTDEKTPDLSEQSLQMKDICGRLCERIGLGEETGLLGLPLDEMWASTSRWHASIVNVTSPSVHSSSIPFSKEHWRWDQREGIGDEIIATWYVRIHSLGCFFRPISNLF